jgi:ribose 5-phosphate isomerase B
MKDSAMKIIIGSDHAGFCLKEDVRKFLGGAVTDAGTFSEDSVDYPDFGAVVARGVSSGKFERGILVCGSGVGMSIVANKFPHVRAALCLDVDTARMSRMHNDANVLVLAGRRTDTKTALDIVRVWLDTDFNTDERHRRRLDKIRNIECEIADMQ